MSLRKQCIIYVFLCIISMLINTLDLLQGFFRISSFAIIIWSFYYFVQVNKMRQKSVYIYALDILFLIFIIYGLQLIASNRVLYVRNVRLVANYRYIVTACLSILPIYAFYYFSLKRAFTDYMMKYIFISLTIISIISYFNVFFIGENVEDFEEKTNNKGYLLVPLLAMLCIVKLEDLKKNILLLVILLLIVLSAKRGTIIVGIISLLYYSRYSFSKKSFKKIFLLLCFLVLTAVTAMYFLEGNKHFVARINDTLNGDTNGREQIYSYYFDYFINQNDTEKLFWGNGAESTLTLFGYHAHNDWLEMALNQGVLGLLCFLFYWIAFWNTYTKIQEIEKKTAIKMIMFSYFLMTFFSMSICEMPIACTLTIGYCLSNSNKNYKKNLIRWK